MFIASPFFCTGFDCYTSLTVPNTTRISHTCRTEHASKMTRRGANNAPQQTKKAYDNRRARNQHNGQQQGPPVNAFLKQPLTIQERLGSPLSAPYPENNNQNKKDHESNIRDGGESQFSLPQHQNDRADNPRELNSNGMESNPARSSSPSRGRGRGKSADRGSGGGWGGRGNSDSRGRGRGYQGRNDDGRGRNDTRNDTRSDTFGDASSTTPPVGNDSDKEFDENVRDLTVTETSRLARFSNHTSEQASYDEVCLRLSLQHAMLFTDAECS